MTYFGATRHPATQKPKDSNRMLEKPAARAA
jgi:hypothetical protein